MSHSCRVILQSRYSALVEVPGMNQVLGGHNHLTGVSFRLYLLSWGEEWSSLYRRSRNNIAFFRTFGSKWHWSIKCRRYFPSLSSYSRSFGILRQFATISSNAPIPNLPLDLFCSTVWYIWQMIDRTARENHLKQSFGCWKPSLARILDEYQSYHINRSHLDAYCGKSSKHNFNICK